MTKRETCEHAQDTEAKYSWCTWRVTFPTSVTIKKHPVDNADCDRCPCWRQKEAPPTVDAQCALCGESKPFAAMLVPIQPKPRVCAECAEKEMTDG